MSQRTKIIKLKPAAAASRRALLNARQKKQVKRLVNKSQELRSFPVYETKNVSVTFDATALSNIPQGDDVTDRNGLKVMPRALEINYEVAAGDPNNIVRVMVVKWTPNNGDDAPTEDEIFYSVPSAQIPINPYVFEKSQRKKFVVLYDRIHYLNTQDRSTQGGRIRLYNSSKRTKMPSIFFNDVGSNSQKNGLYLITQSDSTATTHPQIVYSGVLKFFSP